MNNPIELHVMSVPDPSNFHPGEPIEVVLAYEAREIQRQLTAANANIAQLEQALHTAIDAGSAAAEDKARLDWLEENKALVNRADDPKRPHVCVRDAEDHSYHFYDFSYRAVIDAARKATP